MNGIRAILVVLFRVLPGALRGMICRLCYSAAAAASPKAGLQELLSNHNALSDEIDRVAIRYGQGVHPKLRFIDYPAYFTRRLKPGERVLDVGCAFGAVACAMADAGAVVTGIDIDEAYLRVAREKYRHPRVTYVHGDVTKDVPPGAYDTVVLSNVLEHIDDRVGLIRAIADRVRPKRWLIRVPMLDRDWLVYLKQEVGITHLSDPTHFVEYTAESFRREMTLCGLEIRDMENSFGEIRAELATAT